MNPTVIAAVKGGLGNQMFCYAAARALALRTGRDLLLDTLTGFRRDGYGRAYRLDRFPIAAREAPPGLCLGGDFRSPRHKLARAVARFLPKNHRAYIAEKRGSGPGQLTSLAPARRHLYLNGYWQNAAYFADCAATIRRELAPPAPPDPANRTLAGRIAAEPAPVFLHVRRVRYSPRLDAGYYRDAIARLRSELRHRPRFFLFGDDLEWARTRLGLASDESEPVAHNPDDELADLFLMSRCRHAIAANSSFSWWGAWLIPPSPESLVLFPSTPGWPITPAPAWQTLPNSL